MSALRLPPFRIAALAAFALLAFFGVALAAMPPDNIEEALKEAKQACRQMGGTPNTEAILTVEDLSLIHI